jgi:tetratricopeptide (TPR) repeat protein
MQKTHLFKPFAILLVLVCVMSAFSGCTNGDLAHQKSLAELNTKARQMLQAGDVNGAVARLEAAHDLSPDEPNTTFNLAVAYQMQGNHDKAIALFQQLLEKPGQDRSELEKNLGITYEAKADALDSGSKNPDAKAEPAVPEQAKQQAMDAYQAALQHYRAALNGSKNAADIQKQMDLLQAKLKALRNQSAQ